MGTAWFSQATALDLSICALRAFVGTANYTGRSWFKAQMSDLDADADFTPSARGEGGEMLFLKLLMGHAIMDFWAQSDALAQMKNRNRDNSHRVPPGQKPQVMWPYALTAHALMHGAAVWFITGSVWFGIGETAAHWIIDFGKCENWYGIHQDQVLHIACKFLWLL